MAEVTQQVSAPPVLTRGEWEQLLAVTDRSATPHRDRALLHLFWHFGPTVRQVLQLEVAHVNFLTGQLRWPGGPETVLPDEALHAITSYVSLERDPRSTKLFAGRRGRPLGPAELDRLFRRLRDASGIPVTPRSLRLAALWRLLEAHPERAVTAVLRNRYAAAARAARGTGRPATAAATKPPVNGEGVPDTRSRGPT